ncbi:unnamed protein product, partial [Amoebophrya sp. A120]
GRCATCGNVPACNPYCSFLEKCGTPKELKNRYVWTSTINLSATEFNKI